MSTPRWVGYVMLSLKITFGNSLEILSFLLSVAWSPALVSALAQTCRASESGCVNSCLPLAACRATVSAGVSSSFSLLSFVILCLMTFCVYFLHSLQLCVSVCLSPSLSPFPSRLHCPSARPSRRCRRLFLHQLLFLFLTVRFQLWQHSHLLE